MKFTTVQAVEFLERTPGVLRAMLGGLSDPWVYTNYGPETFCPFDVVGHIHQIAKCLAYQYKDEVGPWMDFQGIFEDWARS